MLYFKLYKAYIYRDSIYNVLTIFISFTYLHMDYFILFLSYRYVS